MKSFAPLLGAALFALVVAACGSASADQPGPTDSWQGGGPQIIARNIAFETKSVTAAAGTAFRLDFENYDSAPHNVSIYASDGGRVFQGEVFGGSGRRVYQVPALKAGTYTFKCDVHPDMTGTLTVG